MGLTDKNISKSGKAVTKFLNIVLIGLYFLAFGILVRALLFRVKAQILQQHDPATRYAVDRSLRSVTDAVVAKGNRLAEQLLQFRHDRLQAVGGVGFAIRTAEMRHENDCFGAMIDCIVDGLERADNTLVVGDMLVAVEGHIEIHLRKQPGSAG